MFEYEVFVEVLTASGNWVKDIEVEVKSDHFREAVNSVETHPDKFLDFDRKELQRVEVSYYPKSL